MSFLSRWPSNQVQCAVDVPEDILARSDVKGFPIISTDGRRILMGFIERAELRYVLGAVSSPTLHDQTLIAHSASQTRQGIYKMYVRIRLSPSLRIPKTMRRSSSPESLQDLLWA